MSSMSEKMLQFVSVTGCSEDVARSYLDACAGNLDMAVGMHMENRGQSPVTENSAARPDAAGTDNGGTEPVLSPKSYKETHGVRAPIPQTTGVLIEELPEVSRRVTRSRRLPQTIFDPFQDYAAVASKRGVPGGGGRKSGGKTKTNQKLTELFRPPHELLFSGSFQEAKQAGRHRKCWLLVNLQDSREFPCQVLNRDLWSNPSVKELVQRHFIFIQIYRVTDEGTKFRQLYHTEMYPTIAIIDPRTGELMGSWGELSADRFVREVRNFLVNNPYADEEGISSCAVGSIINKSEESQLEAAIQASLEDANHHTAVVIASDSSDNELLLSTSEDDEKGVALAKAVTRSRAVVQSQGKSSNGGRGATTANERAHAVPLLTSGGSRKRHSNELPEEDGAIGKKKPRTDLEPVCDAINNIELDRLMSVETKEDDLEAFPDSAKGRRGGAKRGRGKGGRRGKRKSGSSATAGLSSDESAGKVSSPEKPDPDDLLQSGRLQKEQVSQILFRLPDGSRLYKTFMSSSPVQDLIDFIEGHGVKISEHDIVTHFPKRSLLEMDRTSSLRQCGLYPRETLFVHSL